MKRAEIEAKLSEHDRAIKGIQALIRTGMRLILKIEQAQIRLEESQRKTDEQLRLLIQSLTVGTNGRDKPKVR